MTGDVAGWAGGVASAEAERVITAVLADLRARGEAV